MFNKVVINDANGLAQTTRDTATCTEVEIGSKASQLLIKGRLPLIGSGGRDQREESILLPPTLGFFWGQFDQCAGWHGIDCASAHHVNMAYKRFEFVKHSCPLIILIEIIAALYLIRRTGANVLETKKVAN